MKYSGEEHESLGQEFTYHANDAESEFIRIKLYLSVLNGFLKYIKFNSDKIVNDLFP